MLDLFRFRALSAVCRAWRTLFSALTLLCLAPVPARAAPRAVLPDPRPVSVSGYDQAAADAGLQEWGDAVRSERMVHVVARLDSGRARLLINLPPTTDLETAKSWVQDLAPRIGWEDSELYVNSTPGALSFRLETRKLVKSSGLGRSRAELDLETLRTRIAAITDRPALLAIRFMGSQVLNAEPKPALRHHSGSSEYLFFRLQPGAGSLGRMKVDFGIPPRWLAAMIVGFALWLLFPIAALLAARYHVCSQDRIDPVQRMVLFRRWQRGIYFVPMVTAVGAILLSRGSFLMYFGNMSSILLPLAVFVPTLCFSLAARLVSLPLERAAWPERGALPWYRAASKELWFLAISLVVIVAALGIMARGSSGAGSAMAFPLAVMGVPLVFAVGAGIWTAVVNFRRKKGTMVSEPDAPEPLVTAVAALTSGLEKPISRVRICKPREGLVAGTVVLLDGLAVVGSELTDGLETEELAAYIASFALAQPQTRKDRWIQAGLGWSMFAFLGIVIGTVAWGYFSGNPRSFMPVMLGAQPFILIGSMVASRRANHRQQEADFQIAESMSEPQRFLQVLLKVEMLQIATSGMDPSARNLPMAHRRQRLERKLGLE